MKKRKPTRLCRHCGAEFVPDDSYGTRNVYCSKDHRAYYHNRNYRLKLKRRKEKAKGR